MSKMDYELQVLRKSVDFNRRTIDILELIAIGKSTSEIYNAIALLYESRHPGLRCSMLELENGRLLHGGAPSLPAEYCKAIHGIENGPNVGSCGTATYTGKRCIVKDIATDPRWRTLKDLALSHDLRCCWSEPIKDSNGKVLGAFGMYFSHPATPNEEESHDLTSAARLASLVMERDHNQKRIRKLAYTDHLTNLASRAYFYKYLEEIIRSSTRHKRRFSVLYIDLDNFKGVNDSLGHDSGDTLLKKIAERLLIACRDSDFIARLGGDEFCIVTEEAKDDLIASHLAKRLIEAVSQPIMLGKNPYISTCSIGIAHFPQDGQELSTLLKAADTALFSAKDLGKNRYSFYKRELTKKAEYRFYFEQSLKDAISKNQLSLVYQPQVDIVTQKITGVEALIRWNHPDLGQVPPLELVKVAEQIGMIKPLTEFILYAACHQVVAWEKSGIKLLKIAVNISASHFLDQELVSLIKRIITETGIKPSQLELEVTESVVQTSPKNMSVFKKIRHLGVRIAIDDFGTGYSSFASLKHINIDCLKIDKYFIDDIVNDATSRFLTSTMIMIGHHLGYTIVAEGVESEEQLDILKKLGCDVIQGHLFSKPVEANELFKKIQSSEVFIPSN